MHQEQGSLNGSAALVLYKLGRLEVKTEHTERTVMTIQAAMQRSTRRLDILERSRMDRLKDLSGWLTGLVVLILALAGKWGALGAFLKASGN